MSTMIKYIFTLLVLAAMISCKEKRDNINMDGKNIESITFDREKPSLLIEKDSSVIEYGFDTIVRVTKTGIDTTITLDLKDSVVLKKKLSP